MTRDADLRAPVLGAVAWMSALGALHAPVWLIPVALVVAVAWVLHRWRRGRPVLSHVGWLLTGAGVAGVTLMRITAVHASPVAGLARQHAEVTVRLVTTSDPVLRQGRFGPYVVVRARVEEVVGRAARHRVRAPVLVLGDERWRRMRLGSHVLARGRLQPARTRDLSGVLSSARATGGDCRARSRIPCRGRAARLDPRRVAGTWCRPARTGAGAGRR